MVCKVLLVVWPNSSRVSVISGQSPGGAHLVITPDCRGGDGEDRGLECHRVSQPASAGGERVQETSETKHLEGKKVENKTSN